MRHCVPSLWFAFYSSDERSCFIKISQEQAQYSKAAAKADERIKELKTLYNNMKENKDKLERELNSANTHMNTLNSKNESLQGRLSQII